MPSPATDRARSHAAVTLTALADRLALLVAVLPTAGSLAGWPAQVATLREELEGYARGWRARAPRRTWWRPAVAAVQATPPRVRVAWAMLRGTSRAAPAALADAAAACAAAQVRAHQLGTQAAAHGALRLAELASAQAELLGRLQQDLTRAAAPPPGAAASAVPAPAARAPAPA